jgi:hypothetical protein
MLTALGVPFVRFLDDLLHAAGHPWAFVCRWRELIVEGRSPW